MVDVAEIKIWGQLVGAVRWDEKLQLASFQYAPKFLDSGIELSPIKMPLSGSNRIYQFPELRKRPDESIATFKGLPGLLADSLPDRYGNQLINIWLAKNGRTADSMNPVEQLCFIGERGMGALEFEPSKIKTSKQTFALEMDSLVDIARKMLSNRAGFETNLKENEQSALTQILKIGTSAGGARPKAVIAYNKKTGEVRSGQTHVPKGFEHWLLKLDGVSDTQFGSSHGYGRVEYAYYLMAKEAGIQMMDSTLLEENGRAHFMTKRFDRASNDIKYHIQSFCGLEHFDYNHLNSYSYEQLFQCMRGLRLSYPEAEEMFKRMVFNVMAKNCDDHTKNFSFLLKPEGKWELAPAYDLCYSYDPNNIWVNQHSLSINGKRKDFVLEDLLSIAKANNIKRSNKIVSEIKEIVCNWNFYANKSGVDTQLIELIQNNLIAPNFPL